MAGDYSINMKFYTDNTKYSHYGSFYGIPVFLNLEDENPVIEGQNIIFEYLFQFMVFIHIYVIELGAQLIAFVLNSPYEAGFPFWIKGELETDETDIT